MISTFNKMVPETRGETLAFELYCSQLNGSVLRQGVDESASLDRDSDMVVQPRNLFQHIMAGCLPWGGIGVK